MQIGDFLYERKMMVLGLIIGVLLYMMFDKNYYKISKTVHYMTLGFGVYFTFLGFLPAAIICGFHLAYELNVLGYVI